MRVHVYAHMHHNADRSIIQQLMQWQFKGWIPTMFYNVVHYIKLLRMGLHGDKAIMRWHVYATKC